MGVFINMNSAVVVGRAGQDAEIKYFESGKIRTTFSLAVNRWDSKTKAEVTDWFNIDVWDKLAEFAGEYVKKGVQLVVDGRIAQNKWTDKVGDIYIIFSRKEAQEKLNLSDKTVTKAFKELKNKKLIREIRTGFKKNNIIYVGKINHVKMYES